MAQLDPSFLECADDAGFRELARRTLIARYFEPNERAELYRLCGLEIPADDLVSADAARFLRSDQDDSKRDTKFAVRVLPAYDFTCALTRYRMIAIDGSTPLDAAHIQQFKRGGPCEPSNGIALSKTAHWLFDRGFWSIADDYTVVVKSGAFEEAGEASQLLKPHAGRQILLPNNRGVWPKPLFLGCAVSERTLNQAGFCEAPGHEAIFLPGRGGGAQPPAQQVGDGLAERNAPQLGLTGGQPRPACTARIRP